MMVKFIIGSETGSPQGINTEGEQGIGFSARPYFYYKGKKINSIQLWTNDVNNYNEILNTRSILELQTHSEENIRFGVNRLGGNILVIENSPMLRGYALNEFPFKLIRFRKREKGDESFLELDIEPKKIAPDAEGAELKEIRWKFDDNRKLEEVEEKLKEEKGKGKENFILQEIDWRDNEKVELGDLGATHITFKNTGKITVAGETTTPVDDTKIIEKEFVIESVNILNNFVRADYSGDYATITLKNPENQTGEFKPKYITFYVKTYGDILYITEK